MAITEQSGVIIGAENLFDTAKVTQHLYSHLKMDEGAGDILNDSSGNGHDLIWQPVGANATADAAGVWTVDGLSYNGTPLNYDVFKGKSQSDYDFADSSKSSVYVYHVSRTLATHVEKVSLMCKRGGASGTSDGGYEHTISTSPFKAGLEIHNGSTSLAVAISNTTLPVDEKATIAMCFDASANNVFIIVATNTTIAQYEVGTKVTPTGTVDVANSTQTVAIGQRSAAQASDRITNMDIFNYRFYEDTAGGALPENLADIVRWLHQNPTANIPAKWWP